MVRIAVSLTRRLHPIEVVNLAEWIYPYFDVRDPDIRDFLMKTLLKMRVIKDQSEFDKEILFEAESETGDASCKAYAEIVLRKTIHLLQETNPALHIIKFLNILLDRFLDGLPVNKQFQWEGFSDLFSKISEDDFKQCGISFSREAVQFESVASTLRLIEAPDISIIPEHVIETLRRISVLYTHYFLNLIAIVDGERLVLLHADFILCQGQELLKEVGRYNEDHLRVIREIREFDFDSLLSMIESGFIETTKGEKVIIPQIKPEENNWRDLDGLGPYLPPFNESILDNLLRNGFGLVLETNRKLTQIIDSTNRTIKQILKETPAKPYDTIEDLMEATIGHKKNESNTCQIMLLAPYWVGIYDEAILNQNDNELQMKWYGPESVLEHIETVLFFEMLTTADGLEEEIDREYLGFLSEDLGLKDVKSRFSVPKNSTMNCNAQLRMKETSIRLVDTVLRNILEVQLEEDSQTESQRTEIDTIETDVSYREIEQQDSLVQEEVRLTSETLQKLKRLGIPGVVLTIAAFVIIIGIPIIVSITMESTLPDVMQVIGYIFVAVTISFSLVVCIAEILDRKN